MVSERHAVPQNAAIPRLIRFPVPIFANDILNGVQLSPAMIGVDDYLLSLEFALFVSVHKVV